jgi:hypothetical protein
MVPGDGGIFDTECIVDRSTDGKCGALVLREREDSPDQGTGDGNQLWHSPKKQRVQYSVRSGFNDQAPDWARVRRLESELAIQSRLGCKPVIRTNWFSRDARASRGLT